jgi:hypothetical protein
MNGDQQQCMAITRAGHPPTDHPVQRAGWRSRQQNRPPDLDPAARLAYHEDVMIATHDPAAAEFTADLYQLRDGQIVERKLRRSATPV